MKRCLILFSVIALTATMASASVQKGDIELDALGGWLNLNGNLADDLDAYFLAGRLGYFVTDNIQVAGVALGAWLDSDGSADLYGLGVAGLYHFMPDNAWVPYVGGQIMWGSAGNGGTTEGFIWGPVVGVRYELNETNDFFIEYWWQDFEEELAQGWCNMNVLFLGLIHQFK